MNRRTPGTTVPMDEATRGLIDAVIETVGPSVVDVRAFVDGGGLTRRGGAGAGVVWDAAGLVVTSHHVLTVGGEEVVSDLRVILSSGEEREAELVGTEPEADLAVLRIDSEGLVAAEFLEDTTVLRRGDLVIAFGSAGTLERDVTSGRFERVIRGLRAPGLSRLDELLQVTVPLQQGNSGGPLVDAEGRVLGIVMGKSPQDTDRPRTGYVIPSRTVLEIATELVGGGGR